MGSKTAFQKLFACSNYIPKNEYTKQVLSRIHHCHTKDLGYHCYQCSNEECMHTHTQYHSCGNRHCPFCGTLKKDKWVEERVADLFPTPYYHNLSRTFGRDRFYRSAHLEQGNDAIAKRALYHLV